MIRDIIWRALYFKGHEYARLEVGAERILLQGAAVFVDKEKNCKLVYTIECDDGWNTISTVVSGSVGAKEIEIEIYRSAEGVWILNGVDQPQASGCTDIDLNFSPSTNLLPIRRLKLEVDEEAPVRAAWLRFPSFQLELLAQTYRRTGLNTYRYESAGGTFVADLIVNDDGFVTDYSDLWEQEAQ